MNALETGEVQTLLLARNFAAGAVPVRQLWPPGLPHAGKLRRMRAADRALEDVADALLRVAVRQGIEIIHIPDNPDLASVGGVAAVLRFRADQNTEEKKEKKAG